MSAVALALSDPRAAWLMRLGDATLILGHRISEWLSRAPTLEEDIAMANLSLDLIGQTRAFYTRACEIDGGTCDETALAYHRAEPDYRNSLIVEQPNGNFADTMARHLLFSAYALPLYERLDRSNDAETAGIATRSARETAYHLRHTGEWMIRLGDGTAESHDRAQAALDDLWPYVPELFEADDLDREVATTGFGVDPSTLRAAFDDAVDDILARATLTKPAARQGQRGGKQGRHSEHLGHILATLQFLPARLSGGALVNASASKLARSAEAARAACARVPDPEILALTIDDLGILRDVEIDEGGRVTVSILPTYSGCPAMRAIALAIETELMRDGFDDVRVRLTNSPAWTTDFMSGAAREKLRASGISPPERGAGRQSLFGAPPDVACPRCGSTDAERLSEFGSTACKALWCCRACREPFEHFKCV